MSDFFSLEIDASEVLRALDALGDRADEILAEVARETAEAIADEMRRRVARGTGKTADNITVSDHLPDYLGGGKGVGNSMFVYVKAIARPDNLPLWLEFGTRKMTEQPFIFNAARTEQGPHLRRVEAALERAIREVGLAA